MGDVDAVAYLLEQGVDVNVTDSRGTTVFMHAVASGNTEFIDLVESKGGAGDLPDQFILDMVRRNLYEGVQALLRRGYNLNVASRSEGTTLDISVTRGHTELARLLWDAGVAHQLSQDGFTREATRNNHRAVATYLELGFDPNGANSHGEMPLLEAAAGGSDSVLLVLLDAGADPNIQDGSGTTPVMLAASRGDLEIVKLLIQRQADINQRRSTGESALSIAIYNREADTSLLLLEQGADHDISFETAWSARRGSTPLQLARYFQLREVVIMLVEKGAQ